MACIIDDSRPNSPMLIVILCLIGGIAVAHLVGLTLTERFRTAPGHAREMMPTLPSNPVQEGTPDMRWDRSVRRVERKQRRWDLVRVELVVWKQRLG